MGKEGVSSFTITTQGLMNLQNFFQEFQILTTEGAASDHFKICLKDRVPLIMMLNSSNKYCYNEMMLETNLDVKCLLLQIVHDQPDYI